MKYKNSIPRAVLCCLLILFCVWIQDYSQHAYVLLKPVLGVVSVISFVIALGLFLNLHYWRLIDDFTDKIEKHKSDVTCLLKRALVWKALNRPEHALKDLCHLMTLRDHNKETDAACGQLLLLPRQQAEFALYDLLRKLPDREKVSEEEYIEALRKNAIEYCEDKKEFMASFLAKAACETQEQ